MPLRIGLVVGETSGETLALSLIKSLRQRYPDLYFEGILGPRLIAEGGQALFPMERLSVMGLVEPLARLPELLQIRKQIRNHFIQNRPDLFIGVDAPDFTLVLEKHLKQHGIKTVHYVSPSVWAWRESRIHLIKKAVDLMLTLLPFEAEFYEKHQIPVEFVGHPLADEIPLSIDQVSARGSLAVKAKRVITLMPGSRTKELALLSEPFCLAAKYCYEHDHNLEFLVPLTTSEHERQFNAIQQKVAPQLPIRTMVGQVRTALSAADVVLVTSGTATLETMLHKKPMVVAYRMHPLTYWIAKRLVKVPFISLPNLLANRALVPEFIQDKVQPEMLGEAILKELNGSAHREALKEEFTKLHVALQQNASKKAADRIQKLL